MKKLTAAVFAAMLMIITGITAAAGVDISAEYAVLIDAATGRVILDRNADTEYPMASTTKIMTAIVALENSDPDDIVTMSETAAAEEGSSVYLQPGDQVTMRELLYGVMLNSGNDGAAAVAEYIAGSKEAFAEMMNAKAAELGLEHTHFENPSGLDQEGHYTTAADLAQLARYALKNEEFAAIVGTYDKRVTVINRPDAELYFVNHNKLLRQYEGCIGVKTGYTKSTGRCLVSAATRYGMTFIAVTLNAPDDWNDHMKMLDYAFNTYVARTVVADGEIITTENINGTDCDLIAADEMS
ncbi:MAG: D-alanyl-D-alanine carboxypeptidase, partial [Lachnospiraceae bacterium]|nr:D-alanyl-D-alanine carboxypeptidase [Lachnospiraceae bacterium]